MFCTNYQVQKCKILNKGVQDSLIILPAPWADIVGLSYQLLYSGLNGQVPHLYWIIKHSQQSVAYEMEIVLDQSAWDGACLCMTPPHLTSFSVIHANLLTSIVAKIFDHTLSRVMDLYLVIIPIAQVFPNQHHQSPTHITGNSRAF